MRRIGSGVAIVALLAGTGAASATCPGQESIDRFVADWQAKRPGKALPITNLADAACARDKIVAALERSQGRVVGYKAGLTAKAVQERFKADGPVSGTMLEAMILPDGATVPAAYGARPVWEADMLLVVKDAGINAATTPEAALRHISGMRAFVELPDLALAPTETLDGTQLPDLALAPTETLDGTQLLAINVAARLGVAGPEVPLQADADTVGLLASARIVATDASGATLAESTGAATLGNPLNAVIWLVQDLAKAGRTLKAGDLISVHSFTPLTPPKPGQDVTVRYEGLPGTPRVTVRFQ
jgi:2-keto-4-pentenoate hydratase